MGRERPRTALRQAERSRERPSKMSDRRPRRCVGNGVSAVGRVPLRLAKSRRCFQTTRSGRPSDRTAALGCRSRCRRGFLQSPREHRTTLRGFVMHRRPSEPRRLYNDLPEQARLSSLRSHSMTALRRASQRARDIPLEMSLGAGRTATILLHLGRSWFGSRLPRPS